MAGGFSELVLDFTWFCFVGVFVCNDKSFPSLSFSGERDRRRSRVYGKNTVPT